MVQPEVLQLLKLPEARRNLAGQLVIRQVYQLKMIEVGQGAWNLAREGVRREVESFEAEREKAGDTAGEAVQRDVENLKTSEVGDLRRKVAGKRILLQEQ